VCAWYCLSLLHRVLLLCAIIHKRLFDRGAAQNAHIHILYDWLKQFAVIQNHLNENFLLFKILEIE